MEWYGKFSPAAKRVMNYAQEEALRLGHSLIGSEHLLLGLIREEEGIACEALYNFGVEEQDVRETITNLLGKSNGGNGKVLGFSQRTTRIIDIAYKDAKKTGNGIIGTEHLLIGIITEGPGVGVKVLMELNVDIQGLINEIREIMESEEYEELEEEHSSMIDKYGKDLTALAREGRIDPVIGRDSEIERVVQILNRRTKNNPCLVGEPGVGKTAIAEGLAQKIAEGNVNEYLQNRRIITIEMSSMLAGAKFRGEFEERLKKVIDEVIKAKDIVLFIDEIHTIIGAGAAEGAIDASNILKPALARGEIQVIGATTFDEYRKRIEKDSALERRLQRVVIEEPDRENSIKILNGLREKYEDHHKVKITDEAIIAAVDLSSRYITDRFLPDKAVDLMDEASSNKQLSTFVKPKDVIELKEELNKLSDRKERAVQKQDFEEAARVRDLEKNMQRHIEETERNWKEDRFTKAVVDVADIGDIVSKWTGIPVNKLAESESERLLKIENILHERIIGQEDAVSAVSKAIRRARVGLKDPKRPIGSFIFLGPTGVGKTELSKALAEAMFGDENAIIRVDMSEYMEKHSVSKLIGAPPGYVGFESGGQLTEKVRRKPYSVVLLDEIEKAHPDVFNILLQILEDGRLSDSKGKVVDFKNTIIIMTSNVGAQRIKKQKTLGFSSNSSDEKTTAYEKMKENVMEELNKTFSPELLNRIDEVIVFHSLYKENILNIIDILLKGLTTKLKDMNIHIIVTDVVRAYIAEEGYDEKYGARPLRRLITRLIEDKFAEELLKGTIKGAQTMIVDMDGKDIVIKRQEEVVLGKLEESYEQ